MFFKEDKNLKTLITKNVGSRTTITVGEGVPQDSWRNEPDTGDLKCQNCDSWIQHWENCTGMKRPMVCSVCQCKEPVDDGAHVTNPKVQGVWIAPMCHDCNVDRNKTLMLNKGVILVNAQQQYSCERID